MPGAERRVPSVGLRRPIRNTPRIFSAQLRAVPRCRRQTDPKTDALLRAYADVPGRFYDYLRPAARYAIQNADVQYENYDDPTIPSLIDYNIRTICA